MKIFSGNYEERWKEFFEWQSKNPQKEIVGYITGGGTLSVIFEETTESTPEPDE